MSTHEQLPLLPQGDSVQHEQNKKKGGLMQLSIWGFALTAFTEINCPPVNKLISKQSCSTEVRLTDINLNLIILVHI